MVDSSGKKKKMERSVVMAFPSGRTGHSIRKHWYARFKPENRMDWILKKKAETCCSSIISLTWSDSGYRAVRGKLHRYVPISIGYIIEDTQSPMVEKIRYFTLDESV